MKRSSGRIISRDTKSIGGADFVDGQLLDGRRIGDPHWMSDGKRLSYLAPAPQSNLPALWIYDIETAKHSLVIDPRSLKLESTGAGNSGNSQGLNSQDSDSEDEPGDAAKGRAYIPGYQWSPDEKQVLLCRKPHRRSSRGDSALYVYSLATRRASRVTSENGEYHGAKWSPDGKWIGYVRNDDIWVLSLNSLDEIRLTRSGGPTSYNGTFGWVYAEELDLVDGWSWSPDGSSIAYFHSDEGHVPTVPILDYTDLHCRAVEQRFPKSGDPNPAVRVGVVSVAAAVRRHKNSVPKAISFLDIESGVLLPAISVADITAEVEPLDSTLWLETGIIGDAIIARMQWTPDGSVLVQRLPRIQNRIDLLCFEVPSGKRRLVLSEQSSTWVDPPGVSSMLLSEDFHWNDPMVLPFVEGTKQFLWLSDRSGFTHIYLYDLTGRLIRQVTRGTWDVDTICGLDSTHGLVYYTAARPNPMERHLYSSLLNGGGDSVQISEEAGVHRCLFAPDNQHYVDITSSRAVSIHTRIFRCSGHQIDTLNRSNSASPGQNGAPAWEFATFRTSDGIDINAAMLKPHDFDPSKKYPVLMYVYGGPGSQTVVDSHGMGGGLEEELTQKGYIAALVDGRGTGGRGRDFQKIVYKSLGHWEVNDQTEGARWLAGLPYIDATRIGIWGASYGGYVSSLCILRQPETFKAAIAVAPVTDWRLYDSIYTERYMRRPDDNPKGYDDSASVNGADNLKGRFLLIHGTSDDNVHFQHSCRLAVSLQDNEAAFDTMFYPGQGHDLSGVSGHLFKLMSDFITANL